jgi:hypothetical protein
VIQRGGDVWIGDVLAAWSELGPADGGEASGGPARKELLEARVARLLGFTMVKKTQVGSRSPAPATSSTPRADLADETSTRSPRTARPRGPTAGRSPAGPEESGVRRTPAPWGRRLRPAGFVLSASTDAGGPELGIATAQQCSSVLPHRPLISAHTLPAILHAALGTDAGDGDIDIDLLVPLLAAREPITSIPYESRPSLLRGVQLLIDVGPGMAPFRRDARHLARAVTRLVGITQTQEAWFDRSPLDGIGRGPLSTWSRAYEPPPPRTPVLLVTDLGIAWTTNGRGAAPGEWLRFVELLRRRGSGVVAFVPYPASRWPASLASALPIIAWDRPTGVTDVRRAVGNVLGGSG